MEANMVPGTNNFRALGEPEALTAGPDNAPVLAAQAAPLGYRLPLYDAATPEVWCIPP